MPAKLAKKAPEIHIEDQTFDDTLLNVFCATSFADCHSLRSLDWLPGNWVAESEKAEIHETWRKVSPRTFEGNGWTLDKDGKLVSQESLRLVTMDNEVFYMAKVAHNRNPVPFKAMQCSQQSATFVNLDHDFPNSIEYRQAGEEIHVNVEDLEGKGFTLKFKRQAGE